MMTEIEPIDWEARLRDAVAETLAKRAARRAEREQFETRRAYGLARRHANKLRDNARGSRGTKRGHGPAQIEPGGREAEVVNETPSGTPQCCIGAAGGVCPQHEQALRLNAQGPRKRGGRGVPVVGDSGTAKPARDSEDQP